jgi:hypothetical protein
MVAGAGGELPEESNASYWVNSHPISCRVTGEQICDAHAQGGQLGRARQKAKVHAIN